MNEKRAMPRKAVLFLALGVLVFVLYLVFFVDVAQVLSVIQHTNMLAYSAAALMLVLETFLFALTWQYLLIPLSVKIPFKKTLTYVLIGSFADLLIPAESVSGEVAKAYLMSKEPNVNTGKVVASLVSQRMLGTMVTVSTLLICFITLLTLQYSISGFMIQILLSVIVLSVIALLFLIVVCLKEEWTERVVHRVMRFIERLSRGRFTLERYQNRVVDALRAFYDSLRTFGSKPAKLIPSIMFYVLSWLSSIAIVFLVFVSIDYLEPDLPILLLKITVVYALLIAVKSIPLGVPAEVGLPDIFMTTALFLFGIPLDVSAAATILTRILTVWLRFSIGFAAVQLVGVRNLMESGVFAKTKDKV